MIIAIVLIGCLIVAVFGIKIIRTMLHIEKKSNQDNTTKDEPITKEEYHPQDEEVKESGGKEIIPNNQTDHQDDEFFDYSGYMRNKPSRPSIPDDMDLSGDFADDFEYIPSSPDTNYLSRYANPKKKAEKGTLAQNLQELPQELKVLMLSDIFDKLF